MLNNTLLFWAFFFVVYVLYWFVARTSRNRQIVLLAANAAFYASWDVRLLWVPVVLTYINYRGALAITAATRRPGSTDAADASDMLDLASLTEDQVSARRTRLAATVIASIALLVGFRYLDFMRENLDVILGWLGRDGSLPELGVPPAIGISFMTFAALSYTIDVYRGSYPVHTSFARLLTSVSLFPITVAGPITRPRELVPQLEKPAGLAWSDVQAALLLIAVGLFKKTLADVIGVLIGGAYDSTGALDTATAWAAALGYVAQLYADFSGYTDIALGAALLLGLKIPVNFRLPLLAASPVDIWRRWHITLSLWVRDYLYVSFGLRTPYRSLFFAWVIAGIWHGPSWTYFTWGVYQASLIVITAFLTRKLSLSRKAMRRLYPLRWLITFYSWTIGCVVFRAPTLDRAWDIIVAMHSWRGEFLYVTFATLVAAVIAIVSGHALDALGSSGVLARRSRRAAAAWLVLIAVLLTFSFVINPGTPAFIYAAF